MFRAASQLESMTQKVMQPYVCAQRQTKQIVLKGSIDGIAKHLVKGTKMGRMIVETTPRFSQYGLEILTLPHLSVIQGWTLVTFGLLYGRNRLRR